MINIYEAAAYDADAIIIFDTPTSIISKDLMKKTAFQKNKNKVSIIKSSDDESPDYGSISDQMDKILSKLPK